LLNPGGRLMPALGPDRHRPSPRQSRPRRRSASPRRQPVADAAIESRERQKQVEKTRRARHRYSGSLPMAPPRGHAPDHTVCNIFSGEMLGASIFRGDIANMLSARTQATYGAAARTRTRSHRLQYLLR
jgi:hypothetical protein